MGVYFIVRLFLYYIGECRNFICLYFGSCNVFEELLYFLFYGFGDFLGDVVESLIVNSF